MGAIIWIIIAVWVVVLASKGKGQSGSQSVRPVNTMQQKARSNEKNSTGWQQTASRSGEHGGQQRPAGNGENFAARQKELKERLAKKYNRPTESSILERAKASVAEDFDKDQGASKAENSYNTNGGTSGNRGMNGSTGTSGMPHEKQPVGDKSRAGSSPMAAGPVAGSAGTAGGSGMPQSGMAVDAWMDAPDSSQAAFAVMPDAITSDTMKEIENLMITGPDTSIAFERDFVSEGLDMLNQIQV